MTLASEIKTKKTMAKFSAEVTAGNYGDVATEAELRGDDYVTAAKIIKHIAKAFSEGRPILISEPDLRILAGKGSNAEISEKLGSIVTRTTEEAESAERTVADCRIMQDIALEGAEKASAA